MLTAIYETLAFYRLFRYFQARYGVWDTHIYDIYKNYIDHQILFMQNVKNVTIKLF